MHGRIPALLADAGYHRKAAAEYELGELEAAQETCREGLSRSSYLKALAELHKAAHEKYLRESAPSALTKALATNDPLEISQALARARRWLSGARLTEAEARLRALTQVAAAFTFGSSELRPPPHVDPSVFAWLRVYARAKKPAERDVKYWQGAKAPDGSEAPWRDGTTDAAITDPHVIAEEEVRKEAAENEDKAAGFDFESLRARGVRVDWLVQMTFALNLWEWKTWEVVQFLVKPVTERARRCRFADLPEVQKFAGRATVFMSHCWSARWGDLVVAAAAGARGDRIVWIDAFAVRQWPGNGADLDFRGVIRGCEAVVVAAAPVGGQIGTEDMDTTAKKKCIC